MKQSLLQYYYWAQLHVYMYMYVHNANYLPKPKLYVIPGTYMYNPAVYSLCSDEGLVVIEPLVNVTVLFFV